MSTQTLFDNNKEGEKSSGAEAAIIGRKRGLDARSKSNKKTSADIYTRHKHMHDLHKDQQDSSDDDIVYRVEVAKSSKSKCHQSGELIPKGSLRWASYQRGIPINGYVSLQNLTPAMLREAIKVTLNVQGIGDLPTEKDRIEALTILRDVAMRGDEFDKKDRLVMAMAANMLDDKLREKLLLLNTSKESTDTKETGSDDDSWVLVEQRGDLPLKHNKGQKESTIKMGADDGGDGSTPPQAKSLFSTATISALASRSRQKKQVKREINHTDKYCNKVYLPSTPKKRYFGREENTGIEKEHNKGFSPANEVGGGENEWTSKSDSIDRTPQAAMKKSVHHHHFPAARDVIVLKSSPAMKGARGEALCFVESTCLPTTKDNYDDDLVSMLVIVSACMEEFRGTKSISLYNNGQYSENTGDGDIKAGDMTWRFMPSQRLEESSVNTSTSSETDAETKKEQIRATSYSIQENQEMGAAEVMTNQKPLEGLRFVATGVTEEYCTSDMFKAYIRGIVEAAGGKMTLRISGKTDYVVTGDWHYDPFRDTVGTIESGSKYQKAMMMEDCTIISIDDLRYMIELGVDEFHQKVKNEQGRESGVDTMQ